MKAINIGDNFLGSSVWFQPHATIITWITMLLIADDDGMVPCCDKAIANRAVLEVDECAEALKWLSLPDPQSEHTAFDGRRIERCDGGWKILTYEKFCPAHVSLGGFSEREERMGFVYFIRAGTNIKIGFSSNPAGRISALQTAHPERLLLLGQFEAPFSEESALHERFSALHTSGEWFRAETPLLDFIAEMCPEYNPAHGT